MTLFKNNVSKQTHSADPDFNYDAIDQRKTIHPPLKQFVREIIETLVLTLLIFFFVNSLTGRFRIEGQSMEPTMHEDQYLIVNRFSYAFKQPTRGDIVVINYPRDPSRDFIKRVIGIPGDVINIKDGVVMVNGAVIDEPYIIAPPAYEGTWTVPAEEIYVLGDNRLNSSDSHQWGFVPFDLVEGRAEAVYWPLKDLQTVPHHAHDNVPQYPVHKGTQSELESNEFIRDLPSRDEMDSVEIEIEPTLFPTIEFVTSYPTEEIEIEAYPVSK